ncbi:MAG: hypothetical protein WDN28_25455 [Chthoniobacter sp.]
MNLGICLSRQGRGTEGEALLGATHAQADEVARQYPRTWPAAVQLAQLRRDAGHADEALATIREARGRFPETWELVKAESELLRGTAGPAAAIPLVQEFAAAHWWHYDAQAPSGGLRFAAGEPDAAITALRRGEYPRYLRWPRAGRCRGNRKLPAADPPWRSTSSSRHGPRSRPAKTLRRTRGDPREAGPERGGQRRVAQSADPDC